MSLLEEEYMAKAMIRQKEGIVKPQVVAGREFKGTAFICKPDKIIFKVSPPYLTAAGLHGWHVAHSDGALHQCFVFLQLVQAAAAR